MSDKRSRARLATLTRSLVGQRVSRAELGHGTFVDVDFGELRATVPPSRRSHGEWHLWVYSAPWRVDHRSKPLGGSLDDEKTMQSAIGALANLVLCDVVFGSGLHWIFEFEDATSLHVFGASKLGSEHWILFTPDGQAVSVGPGDGIRFGPADS
jgi:hypothetical protein